MAKILTFTVEIEQPAGAAVVDVRAYIEDAVKTWAGSLHPPGVYGPHDHGDPMWRLKRESVKVRRLRENA
jgi:hypothetical protein